MPQETASPSITPKSLAQTLSSNFEGVPWRLPREILALAEASQLVIVYRFSGDTTRFAGIHTGMQECWADDEIWIDDEGFLPDFEFLPMGDKETFREYFQREDRAVSLVNLFDPAADLSWSIKTDIAHETFVFKLGDKPFCRGIVFSMEEVRAAMARRAAKA